MDDEAEAAAASLVAKRQPPNLVCLSVRRKHQRASMHAQQVVVSPHPRLPAVRAPLPLHSSRAAAVCSLDSEA